MIFNGFPIWFAVIVAVVGSVILVISHFLKIQRKSFMVPTLLFWHRAVGQSKRKIMLGKFGSILIFLFLLFIVLLMSFTLLSPAINVSGAKILIIDTSAATDIVQAQKIARSIVRQGDRVAVFAVGHNVKICANFDDSCQTALAAIDRIITDKSSYSCLDQAVREARVLDSEAKILVVSGQDLHYPDEIEVLACSVSDYDTNITPISVNFPEELQQQGQFYCQADNRFEYCHDRSIASLSLEYSVEGDINNPNRPEFVATLSDTIERQAGIKYRQPISKIEGKPHADLLFSLSWKYDKAMYGAVLLLLIMEIYLFKKHKLV